MLGVVIWNFEKMVACLYPNPCDYPCQSLSNPFRVYGAERREADYVERVVVFSDVVMAVEAKLSDPLLALENEKIWRASIVYPWHR